MTQVPNTAMNVNGVSCGQRFHSLVEAVTTCLRSSGHSDEPKTKDPLSIRQPDDLHRNKRLACITRELQHGHSAIQAFVRKSNGLITEEQYHERKQSSRLDCNGLLFC